MESMRVHPFVNIEFPLDGDEKWRNNIMCFLCSDWRNDFIVLVWPLIQFNFYQTGDWSRGPSSWDDPSQNLLLLANNTTTSTSHNRSEPWEKFSVGPRTRLLAKCFSENAPSANRNCRPPPSNIDQPCRFASSALSVCWTPRDDLEVMIYTGSQLHPRSHITAVTTRCCFDQRIQTKPMTVRNDGD